MTEAKVATALAEAKSVIDVIRTDAELTEEEEAQTLAEAKASALAELDRINPDDYSGEERIAVENALAEARAKIESADTVSKVSSAVSAANSTISAQKTDAQKKAEQEQTNEQTAPVKPEKQDLKGIKGLKVKAGKGKLTVKWKKATKKELKTFQGYEIQYTLDGTFTDYPAKKVGKKKASATLSKLARKNKYTVRIRRYRDDGFVLHVSAWKDKKTKTK